MDLQLVLGFLLCQVILFSAWEHLNYFFQCNKLDKSSSKNDPLGVGHEFILPSESPLKDHGVIPRAYPRWYGELPCGKANSSFWWHTKVQRSPAKEGWLFVKEMKTGSSTVGGVVLRIARNVAKRRSQTQMCNFRIDHSAARNLQYKHRHPNKSYLFTFIRHPVKRLASEFFHFQVSRAKTEPHDKLFQRYFLTRKYLHDYYLRDLTLVDKSDTAGLAYWGPQIDKHSPGKRNFSAVEPMRIKAANKILQEYDFVGITERFDESLVVMQLLTGLRTFDMLYLTAKGSGGYDDGAYLGQCTYIVPSFISAGMKKFFASDQYYKRSAGDIWLYEAAKKSLDLTIDGLGRDLFNERLKQFKAAMDFVQQRCGPYVVYPCSDGGVRANFTNQQTSSHTDCLWLDSGCGAECIDALEEEINDLVGAG